VPWLTREVAHASGFVLVGNDLVIADVPEACKCKKAVLRFVTAVAEALLCYVFHLVEHQASQPPRIRFVGSEGSDGSSVPLIPDVLRHDQLPSPVDNWLYLKSFSCSCSSKTRTEGIRARRALLVELNTFGAIRW